MIDDLIREIEKSSATLLPIESEMEPRLPLLDSVQGIVFDIYGTLFISASGDISLSADQGKSNILANLLAELDIPPPHPSSLSQPLVNLIQREHKRLHQQGISHPEIEIRDLWQELLGPLPTKTVEILATRYECQINPVWPMPHLCETLQNLRERNLALGIVSNAQFFTPLLFDSLTGKTTAQHGFDPSLCFYSYEHRQAKPGLFLYEQLVIALNKQNLLPANVLYIGNDILNDIHPAAQLGFKTALFAGDQRSLRLRPEHPNLHQPDAIITSLAQIPRLLKTP